MQENEIMTKNEDETIKTEKLTWETPKLIDLDANKTESGTGSTSDATWYS